MGWLSNLLRRPKLELPPRAELERRPLADLHAYASQAGIGQYRLLRKEALVEALDRRRR
jgi:hypothetical protein